jgi:signal transduction histidine kinase
MKISKLYIKIALSFLIILIIAEILIFGFFIIGAGKHFKEGFIAYTSAKLLLAKENIETSLANPTGSQKTEGALDHSIQRLGELYQAKVWLTLPDGRLVKKSFKEKVPSNFIKKTRKRNITLYKGVTIYHRLKNHMGIYTVIPIELGTEGQGKLHILFPDFAPPHPGPGFAIGLLVIGLIIALLILPVSRLVTRPINQLRLSALKIAKGDLSHRAEIKTKDEIGDLSQAFNHMAGKLERMLQSNKELTAQISHELRSPLARIQVATELIKENENKDDRSSTTKHLTDIQVDINELDHLIGRILELSKLDLQPKFSSPIPISPGTILNTALIKYEAAILQKKLKVLTHLDQETNVLGSEEALVTAIFNLIDNAIKFSPMSGQIQINTKTEAQHFIISITNNHPPIPDDELEQIFKPFYRSDPSQTKGTGLGLAIVKKIIEQHQGTIGMKNVRDGIEVFITLPLYNL